MNRIVESYIIILSGILLEQGLLAWFHVWILKYSYAPWHCTHSFVYAESSMVVLTVVIQLDNAENNPVRLRIHFHQSLQKGWESLAIEWHPEIS